MVGEMQRISDVKTTIAYHEKKVERGIATVLHTNMLGSGAKQLTEELEDTANLNKRTGLRYMHCSLNLAPGEELTEKQFREVADTYLKSMGYENCPFVAYLHRDKKHTHFHIVASTIDFDGKRVDNFNERRKSREALMAIERRYGLRKTARTGKGEQQSYSLGEKESLKRRLSTAEKAAAEAGDESALSTASTMGEAERARFYTSLGYMELTDKERLVAVLEKSIVRGNPQETITNARRAGLYARFTKKDNSITYGIQRSDGTFSYHKEKSLPKGLWTGKAQPPADNTKYLRFLSAVARNAANKATDMEQFRAVLSTKGVVVKVTPTGILFSQEGREEARGSDLDRGLSLGNITKRIAENRARAQAEAEKKAAQERGNKNKGVPKGNTKDSKKQQNNKGPIPPIGKKALNQEGDEAKKNQDKLGL